MSGGLSNQFPLAGGTNKDSKVVSITSLKQSVFLSHIPIDTGERGTDGLFEMGGRSDLGVYRS